MVVSVALLALVAEAWRIWPEGSPLVAGAMVLALTVVGVWVRARVVWLCVALLSVGTAGTGAALVLKIVPDAGTWLHGSDFNPLGGLILAAASVVAFGVACIAARLAFVAVRALQLEPLRGPSVWASSPVAVAAALVIAWSCGYQYVGRALPKQHACSSGDAVACVSLAKTATFDAEQRRAFARRACERGNSYGCQLSLGGDSGAETDAVAERRCREGDTATCTALGETRLRRGDVAAATSLLDLACDRHPDACVQSARIAERLGHRDLHEALSRRGCDRDVGPSCVALLRHFATGLDAAARDALQLKACLLTDVNECFVLIRSKPATYCPTICQAGPGTPAQSCYYCGLEARQLGQPALAAEWFAQSCANGFSLACEAIAAPTTARSLHVTPR